MSENSSPLYELDRTLLASLVTGVIVAALLIAIALHKHRSTINMAGSITGSALSTRAAVSMFDVIRYTLGIVGAISLLATMLPGLTPFKDRMDPNLGIGGIGYLFLWPFVIAQIVLAFLPIQKWVTSQPLAAWSLLIVLGFIALSVDVAAFQLGYN